MCVRLAVLLMSRLSVMVVISRSVVRVLFGYRGRCLAWCVRLGGRLLRLTVLAVCVRGVVVMTVLLL